jgi:hypothetical protein
MYSTKYIYIRQGCQSRRESEGEYAAVGGYDAKKRGRDLLEDDMHNSEGFFGFWYGPSPGSVRQSERIASQGVSISLSPLFFSTPGYSDTARASQSEKKETRGRRDLRESWGLSGRFGRM